jgi:serine/threonine-protein kinase HipA
MFKQLRSLNVFIEDNKVGTIALTSDNICAFEYSVDWLQNGFSISPFYLPLKKEVFISKQEPFNGLFGIFNDTLPDGWGRLLIDRIFKKNKINFSSLSPIDRLSVTGSNGMGALIYKPGNLLVDSNNTSDLKYLQQEVNKILNDDYTGNIEALIAKNGSSSGARPKVLIRVGNEDWLIKFRSSQDFKDIGVLEYEYSLSAKKAGIFMPETRLFDGKYFGVKRFDRDSNKRIHVHTAAGLLNASHTIPSLDYKTLMEATLALTKDMSEVEKIYRFMIFNVLTSNKDDHSKNFSFIYKSGKWYVSPAYDLVYSEGFNGNHTTTVLGEGNPKKLHMFELAKEIGINKKKYESIFDEVFESTKHIRKLITSYIK